METIKRILKALFTVVLLSGIAAGCGDGALSTQEPLPPPTNDPAFTAIVPAAGEPGVRVALRFAGIEAAQLAGIALSLDGAALPPEAWSVSGSELALHIPPVAAVSLRIGATHAGRDLGTQTLSVLAAADRPEFASYLAKTREMQEASTAAIAEYLADPVMELETQPHADTLASLQAMTDGLQQAHQAAFDALEREERAAVLAYMYNSGYIAEAERAISTARSASAASGPFADQLERMKLDQLSALHGLQLLALLPGKLALAAAATVASGGLATAALSFIIGAEIDLIIRKSVIDSYCATDLVRISIARPRCIPLGQTQMIQFQGEYRSETPVVLGGLDAALNIALALIPGGVATSIKTAIMQVVNTELASIVFQPSVRFEIDAGSEFARHAGPDVIPISLTYYRLDQMPYPKLPGITRASYASPAELADLGVGELQWSAAGVNCQFSVTGNHRFELHGYRYEGLFGIPVLKAVDSQSAVECREGSGAGCRNLAGAWRGQFTQAAGLTNVYLTIYETESADRYKLAGYSWISVSEFARWGGTGHEAQGAFEFSLAVYEQSGNFSSTESGVFAVSEDGNTMTGDGDTRYWRVDVVE